MKFKRNSLKEKNKNTQEHGQSQRNSIKMSMTPIMFRYQENYSDRYDGNDELNKYH